LGANARRIDGIAPPIALFASGQEVAIAPATSDTTTSTFPRPAYGVIEIRDATSGHLISSLKPQGYAWAVGLADRLVAAMVSDETLHHARLERYDRATGSLLGATPLPLGADLHLDMSDNWIVYYANDQIHTVNTSTGVDRVIAKAHDGLINPSIEGNQLAWAENEQSGGHYDGLIKTLVLTP
jgi:hypothetical protein